MEDSLIEMADYGCVEPESQRANTYLSEDTVNVIGVPMERIRFHSPHASVRGIKAKACRQVEACYQLPGSP